MGPAVTRERFRNRRPSYNLKQDGHGHSPSESGSSIRSHKMFIWFALLVGSSLGSSPSHSNNWAVILSPSMFWLNYRHESNVLALYRTIKRLGIDDSHVIFMNADDFACNQRNPFPATIHHNESHSLNLYDGSFEVRIETLEMLHMITTSIC